MPFVNELASNEDIESFNLVELMDKYRPAYKGGQFENSPPSLTIDRDRNFFFMPYAQGREEIANRTSALLWIDGQCLKVEIDLSSETSQDTRDVPYRLVWNLALVAPKPTESQSLESTIQILKEALTAYGYRGAHKQLPNTQVDFNF